MESLPKLGYKINEILEAFGLDTPKSCQTLEDWTSSKFELTEVEHLVLNDLHQHLSDSVRDWNEEELKINFMGLLFYVAKVNLAKKIKVFYERSISAKVGERQLSVKANCLIASAGGRGGFPKTPYFFLQEFKRKTGEKEDPEGQMLTAMLIAQALNNDKKPLYGAWLHGNDWTFATLVGKNYCISREYDTTQLNDLYTIVYSMRKLRETILANYS